MAIRKEDLTFSDEAVLYRFPVERVRPPRARIIARRHRAQVRRRRLGLGVVALSIIGLTLAGGGVGGDASAGHHTPRAIVVRPGQTLWDIAERHAPSGIDPRVYVDALEQQNDIDGVIQPGTRLELP
jgi:Tfp pilus assembly protein FimV